MNINAEAGPSSSPSSSPSPLPRRTSSRLDIVAGATYATPRTSVDGPAPTKTVDQGDQGYGRLEDLDLDAALEGFKVDGDHRQRDGGLLWDEKQISKENEERDYCEWFIAAATAARGTNSDVGRYRYWLMSLIDSISATSVSHHLDDSKADDFLRLHESVQVSLGIFSQRSRPFFEIDTDRTQPPPFSLFVNVLGLQRTPLNASRLSHDLSI